MATRRHWRFIVRDQYGFAIQNARVDVFQPGTSNAFTGTAHTAMTGGSALTNPFTTNSQGEVEAWFTNAQSVDVQVSDNGGTAYRAVNGSGAVVPFTTFKEEDEIHMSPADDQADADEAILQPGVSGDILDIDAGDATIAGATGKYADAGHQHEYTTVPNAHGIAQHTDVTRFLWLPIHDGVVLDGGTLASRGTAPDIIRVITLADAVTSGASWAFLLPDDYVTNSSLTFEIYHAGQTTTSGSVRWSTNMDVRAEGGSIVTVQGSAAFTGQAPTTADLLVIEAGQALGVTGVAGDLVRINIRRLGADGADNYAASTSLIGLKVSYTGSQ